MSDIPPTVNQWIPIIGTLGGAVIGFATSFAVSLLNAKKTETKEAKNRKRETYEDIYKTLIIIRSDFHSTLGECLNKIHHDIKSESTKHDGIPPIIKAEMLIKLYGGSLNNSWDQFIVVRDSFGSLYADILLGDYKKNTLNENQELSGKVVTMFSKLDDAIDVIQKKIASVIEL